MSTNRSSPAFTVVVLGGYGNFGSVISRRLARIAEIDVVIAGRDPRRLSDLANETGVRATILDIDDPLLSEKLKQLHTQLVISTVGPFQRQDYRVAQAAIAANAHYVDLADARNFVVDIDTLDAAACARGVLVTSGASSVPAFSGAVVDAIRPRFSRLDEIHHGISSSEKIPGLATVAAVLGYCGKPLQQWSDGQWTSVHGWQDLQAHDFPEPLGRRWIANCDVPDLELFPARYPGVRSVRFSAGVGLRLSQFGIWLLSWLVRARLLRDPARLAGILRKVAIGLEPLGDGLSGMFVSVRGVGHDGKALHVLWELVARNNQGPNIPCMAAVALARKLANGWNPECGARPCVGLLTLDEYLAELRDLDITILERA